jgi:hypothetical protein
MTKPLTVALLGAALASPVAAEAQNAIVNGWEVYTNRVSHITCDGRPVLLNGSHTDLTLNGPCRYVRITGAHNDVTLTIVPGGTIEITGAHNDVFWYPVNPAAARPILLDHGYSNTFHRRAEGGN